MSITVEAVFENGVLRPLSPLPLSDLQKVRITVQAERDWVSETYGSIAWPGDPDDLVRFALDPEFSLEESP